MRTPVPPEEASDSTLKRRECGWCGQTLYRAKQGHCGEIYGDRAPCHWVTLLHKPKKAPRSPQG